MDCRFYKVDAHEKAEHDSIWNSISDSMKRQIEEWDSQTEEYAPRSPYKFDNLPCQEFCTYFKVQDGYPGETLYCCSHPDNRQILDIESVFDGMDDPYEIGRLLDAIC
jgi:hypothetical protein